jgi:hypothetical protein
MMQRLQNYVWTAFKMDATPSKLCLDRLQNGCNAFKTMSGPLSSYGNLYPLLFTLRSQLHDTQQCNNATMQQCNNATVPMMMQRLQNYVWTSELVRAVVTNGNISETFSTYNHT